MTPNHDQSDISSPTSSSSTTPVALVTGASRGIGYAVAEAFVKAGYHVVAIARNIDALSVLAHQAEACGQSFHALRCDVSDARSVDRVFSHLATIHGRLDVLFNNAGVGAPAVPIDELPVDTWQNVVNTNLTGVFLCTRAAVGLMKRQQPRGGRIINNGSISAHAPRPNSIAYTATKHAITGMTKSTSLDGRAFDIACGQIDIGNAETELAVRMSQGVPQANGDIAIEPLMDLTHVADSVLYMAGLPLTANVQFLTVMATKMPFVGRG